MLLLLRIQTDAKCSEHDYQQDSGRADCGGCRSEGHQRKRGLPAVKGMTGLKLKALHAEHAPVEMTNSSYKLDVGDKIEISVHYHDATIQLHRRMYGMRKGRLERIFCIEHGD